MHNLFFASRIYPWEVQFLLFLFNLSQFIHDLMQVLQHIGSIFL